MTILESLGINPILIIAQMISFAIVYFVFNRFLYPKLKAALEERREAISKTFADKAEIENRLQSFEQEQKLAQKKAAEDIQKMISEAKDAAAATKADLVSKAKEAANAEVALAQKRIEQERINAEAEVAKHAKTLAQSIVQQILADKANDPQWQQQQVQASMDTLKQNKS
jgi:F-type H+-transporting ATPase subunit b